MDFFYRRTPPKESADIALHAYHDFTVRRNADVPPECIQVLRDAQVPANEAVAFVVRGVNRGQSFDAIMTDAQAFAEKQRRKIQRTGSFAE